MNSDTLAELFVMNNSYNDHLDAGISCDNHVFKLSGALNLWVLEESAVIL